MKIFKIEGDGDFAGGVVLVAANSAEQAAEMGNKLSSATWGVLYEAKDAVEVSGVYTEPTVILHYEMGE